MQIQRGVSHIILVQEFIHHLYREKAVGKSIVFLSLSWCGATLYPMRGEGTRFAFTVWEEAANRCDCSAKSIARLSCCPLLPSWKANSCTGLKRCCQRSGLSLASVCHPRTVMRSENSWCSLVFLQDQCFPGVAWEFASAISVGKMWASSPTQSHG